MVTQTFGDTLFCTGSKSLSSFPSPESLKGKIIISTKPPKEYLETKIIRENKNGDEKEKKASEGKSWGKEVSDLTSQYKNFNQVY